MNGINPIGWLCMAINAHPSEPSEHPWHAGTSRPARIGWHERYFTDGLDKHWWDGAQWLSGPGGTPHWRQVGDYPAWRRLSTRWKLTRVPMAPHNRMLRFGFGQNDGRWFVRLDLWAVGWRVTK